MSSSARDPRQVSPLEALATLAFFGAILLMLLLSGCSPRIYERVVYQKDTTYVERVKVDSVFKRDSVFVREKGDTVYIYKEHIREKWRYVHDTTRIVKIDTVAVERVKEVKVEKSLSWWQKAKIGGFWYLLAGFLLLLAWTFRKPLLKLLHL